MWESPKLAGSEALTLIVLSPILFGLSILSVLIHTYASKPDVDEESRFGARWP